MIEIDHCLQIVKNSHPQKYICTSNNSLPPPPSLPSPLPPNNDLITCKSLQKNTSKSKKNDIDYVKTLKYTLQAEYTLGSLSTTNKILPVVLEIDLWFAFWPAGIELTASQL